MLYPRAYHITWGTYGARLHGSDRPHVDRDHNEYGTPFAPADLEKEESARHRMTQSPVTLSPQQRKEVEQAIRDFAARFGFTIHAIAIQTDHSHVVITADRVGDELREALKACASRALNKTYGKRKWWAENGSTKWLWELDYFENATDYVARQRDF
jgi:REP element-mobilizing transposase RayT